MKGELLHDVWELFGHFFDLFAGPIEPAPSCFTGPFQAASGGACSSPDASFGGICSASDTSLGGAHGALNATADSASGSFNAMTRGARRAFDATPSSAGRALDAMADRMTCVVSTLFHAAHAVAARERQSADAGEEGDAVDALHEVLLTVAKKRGAWLIDHLDVQAMVRMSMK